MTAFELVPVIDLMTGLVVHARAGDRDRYRPLEGSVIAASPEPEAVIRGLLDLHPFRSCYIADLDAIRKQGDHKPLIRDLKLAFPEIRFWVDGAFTGECACRRFLSADLGDLVLGSESQDDPRLLELFRDDPRVVLSLDFMGDRPLGASALFETPDLWPERVIVMTLARVGVGAGPDLDRLRAVRAAAPDKRIYAAGGVRGADDLAALEALGCAGVLVASALHDGRLGRDTLATLAGGNGQGATSASQS
jgi:phosphoribosylformimino-5-aminoimidazole carboxamide ribotide isomerase